MVCNFFHLYDLFFLEFLNIFFVIFFHCDYDHDYHYYQFHVSYEAVFNSTHKFSLLYLPKSHPRRGKSVTGCVGICWVGLNHDKLVH